MIGFPRDFAYSWTYFLRWVLTGTMAYNRRKTVYHESFWSSQPGCMKKSYRPCDLILSRPVRRWRYRTFNRIPRFSVDGFFISQCRKIMWIKKWRYHIALLPGKAGNGWWISLGVYWKQDLRLWGSKEKRMLLFHVRIGAQVLHNLSYALSRE